MSDNTGIRLLEFEIVSSGNTTSLISNSFILNILCSTFAPEENQVVVKISSSPIVKLSVLTKDGAYENLLTAFFDGNVIEELKVIDDCFEDVSIKDVKLTQSGWVVGACNKDFQEIALEAEQKIKFATTSNYSERSSVSIFKSAKESVLLLELTKS